MQNRYVLQGSWQPLQLAKSFALVILCLLLWFLPITHNICEHLDIELAYALNHSLLFGRAWQLLWGYLNHPNENWMNIIFMFTINMLGIFTIPKNQRLRAIALVIYCWITFQICLLVTHKIFADWIEVQRNSPSLSIEPWNILSELLNIPNIKVYSHSSFPAGHALVLVFWLKFIELYANTKVQILAAITAVMLTLPRLISGAHWISDIIFTICYSLFWFHLVVGTPLFALAINFLEQSITNPRRIIIKVSK